ncbi:hypothetical protein IQ266_23685 [filamentous cyanobacterium LEGE 11480]|uniref:Uncharacterized protein n=1 Tax=Romeriopsis navalis LEGE 11480 TaxID=2777977 RepID=A0A928VQ67_9CYAN|nr:hypothetical protein [Romeriopsis navalis]MBE9032743.1 hypothetical protein [Romeriopsis navalis LEGE 11480]
MTIVKQLELNLWEVLQEANAAPEVAEFAPIWDALDAVLPGLKLVEQLQTAAVTIGQVTDIFEVQAGIIFEEITATASLDGPVMPGDAFDRYVRQYMDIDFDQYLDEPEAFPRAARSVKPIEDDFYSTAESVEKDALLEVLHEEIVLSEAEAHAEALSVAHGEDVSDWIEVIQQEIMQIDSDVTLEQLRLQVSLPFIELWLGLLLGGYSLYREAVQEEEFYSPIGIIVQQ